MAKISVSPEELEGEAAYVKQQAQAAMDTFTATKGRLSGLTAMFTGQAQQKFQARYDEWHKGAEQQIQALDALGQFLDTAAKTLRDTDQQLASGLG